MAFHILRQRTFVTILACSTLLGTTSTFMTPSTHSAPGAISASSVGAMQPLVREPLHFVRAGIQPPTDAQCRVLSSPCYSPQELWNAYNLVPVLTQGYTGTGETIVIVDSFGSPTIANDLKVFDAGYHLPDPPSFKVLAPLGSVTFNPLNSDQVGWAGETTLDVEWAHAMAPGASIVLLTSPVAETEGVQGLPQFAALEWYALSHNLGQVISQSWGATEETLFNTAGIKMLKIMEAVYAQAVAQHVTVFASAGDSGSSNVDVNNSTYPYPTVNYPAASPNVTAVGGTSLTASTSGVYGSEMVWNDHFSGASGGGISYAFAEPSYQTNSISSTIQSGILKGHRGLPDIAYNADPNTSILIYSSYPGAISGYSAIGGTSEGAPQWAGIIADANQMAGRPLGFINPALYSVGSSAAGATAFHDITVGSNGLNGIAGYPALPGWDASTGWGTPNAAVLLPKLIAATP